MTKIEVADFVNSEIAARYRDGLNPTQQGDWIRAVWKAGDIETARRTVQAIVDNPEATLTLKAFYRALHVSHKRAGQALPPILNPWVLCLTAPADHPEWQGQEWIRLDSLRPPDCTGMAYVAQYAHDVAKAVEHVYGGQWVGVVRPEGQLPENQPMLYGAEARAWAEKHILNGPDGPGRRMLLARPGNADPVSQMAAGLKQCREPGQEG